MAGKGSKRRPFDRGKWEDGFEHYEECRGRSKARDCESKAKEINAKVPKACC